MKKVMELANEDLKTVNVNVYKDLKGNLSWIRRRMKDFSKMEFLEMKQNLKWKISLEGINNWLDTKKETKTLNKKA